MYRRVDSLTHRSWFKLTMGDTVVFEVVRHVESFTMVRQIGPADAPQNMIDCGTAVWVDPIDEDQTWKDAAKVQAYSIMPDAVVEKAIGEAIEETEAKPFLMDIPPLTEDEERVAVLGRLRRQVERLKGMNRRLVIRAERAEDKLQKIREVFHA
jgi:hypothetical protein